MEKEQLTRKEKEIFEVIKENPTLEQEEIAKRIGMTRTSVAGHLARLIKKGYIQRGYIFKDIVHGIAVIGGANVDIKGAASSTFIAGSSNPGKVFKTAGGVGRNVAENLGRLGLPTNLFTAVGKDSEGDWLMDVTAKARVNIQYVERLVDYKTGMYLSVLDDNKEQVASIADMEIIDNYNIESLQKHVSTLLNAKIAFIDTNLPNDSLEFIFDLYLNKEIPIIVDPVSVKKADKISKYLNNVYLLTPNKEEAEILTGFKINIKEDLNKTAEIFFSLGVKNLIITLGAEGVFVANSSNQAFIPSPKVNVIDTTGAGDAFVAGVIYGLYNNKDIFEASKYGHTMSAFTLEKEETVVTDISKLKLEKRIKELF